MRRKMAAFKCQCIDICKWDISTLVRDSGGVHGDDSVASTHRLLPAEMVQARLVPGVLLLLQRPGLLWGSCVPFLCSWCGLGMSKMLLPAQPREPNPLSIVIQLWRLQPVRCQSICEQSHALVSMVSRWSPAHIDKDIFMCLSLDMNLRSKTFSGAHTHAPPALWGTWESFGLPCGVVCGKPLTIWSNSHRSNKKPQECDQWPEPQLSSD